MKHLSALKTLLATGALTLCLTASSFAQYCTQCGQGSGCDCDDVPYRESPESTTDGQPRPPLPGDVDSTTPIPDDMLSQPDVPSLSEMNAPSASAGSIAASLGSVAGTAGIPSMIGDFFAGNYTYAGLPGSGGTGGGGPAITVATAGGDRIFKLAENNSPFPQDRVFFNYHHFHNAVLDLNSNARNLDRYTFGLEKTILDGWASVEVRAPFAHSVSTSPTAFTSGDLDGTDFGNIAFAVKSLVCRAPDRAVSVGLGIVFPTGDDYVIGGDVIENSFGNDTVYLQPFVGVYHAPHELVFSQFFAQVDVAANGNDVRIGSTVAELTSQTLLLLDYSIGVWLVRDAHRKYIRGVAPMLEIHYTTTLDDQEYGPFASTGTFVEDRRRDVLNLTGGLYFQIGNMSSLKVGGVAPLRDGLDKAFDSEIGVQFVRRY